MSPSVSSDPATITQRYDALVASGTIERDPAQETVVVALDALGHQLRDVKQTRFGLNQLLGRGEISDEKRRGIYIFGGVGRGKTMLMDLFFESAPLEAKRRMHFREFMADVHERLRKAREKMESRRRSDSDPLSRMVRALANEAKLLCLDELAVTDIADAMMLGRVLTELLSQGVVLVATSNVDPDRLYEGGIYRELFLPFVALLKLHVDVVNLDARTDFRLEKREEKGGWYTPADANAKAELDRVFARLTDNVPPESLTFRVVGRTIRVPLQARGVARFSFRDLCLTPMAAVDYIAIAQRFHTLIIDSLPARFDHRNHVKRLCSLIDVLYEQHVKLIVSADGEPHSIYLGMVAAFGGAIGPPPDQCGTFPELLESRRAVSRLIEMRSRDYLGRLREVRSPH
ncbi:cell division protein ZapE [Nitrobacteraceae bacterium AZCC 1564]